MVSRPSPTLHRTPALDALSRPLCLRNAVPVVLLQAGDHVMYRRSDLHRARTAAPSCVAHDAAGQQEHDLSKQRQRTRNAPERDALSAPHTQQPHQGSSGATLQAGTKVPRVVQLLVVMEPDAVRFHGGPKAAESYALLMVAMANRLYGKCRLGSFWPCVCGRDDPSMPAPQSLSDLISEPKVPGRATCACFLLPRVSGTKQLLTPLFLNSAETAAFDPPVQLVVTKTALFETQAPFALEAYVEKYIHNFQDFPSPRDCFSCSLTRASSLRLSGPVPPYKLTQHQSTKCLSTRFSDSLPSCAQGPGRPAVQLLHVAGVGQAPVQARPRRAHHPLPDAQHHHWICKYEWDSGKPHCCDSTAWRFPTSPGFLELWA